MLAVLSGCTGSLPTNGPIQFEGADLEQLSYSHADKGERVVFGALTVTNDGDEPASLEDARLTGPDDTVVDDGATLTEVRAREVRDGRDLVGAGPWPYESFADESVELKDFTLRPGVTVELLFIVTVEEVGHWFWPSTELTYSIGDLTWVARTRTGALICPPDLDRECDPPTSE